MKTRTTRIKLGLGALALWVGVAVKAASLFDVNALNLQYTTYVAMGSNVDGDIDARTTISPTPISDSLYGIVSGQLAAKATTGILGVSAFTSMGGLEHLADIPVEQYATASAESKIWFSPLTSGTTTIELGFLADYNWSYSAGSVSLIDLTLNQTLWNYGWAFGSGGPQGTVPWTGLPGGPASATLTFETDFNAADTYILTMDTQTFADSDEEQTSIQLSGLEVVSESPTFVPEPSAFVLAGLGVVFLLTRNRHAMQMSARHINVMDYKPGMSRDCGRFLKYDR